jgi:hypothetical protein
MVILLGNAGLMVSTGRVCPDDKKKWPDRRIGRRSGPMDLTKGNEVRRTTAVATFRTWAEGYERERENLIEYLIKIKAGIDALDKAQHKIFIEEDHEARPR